MKDVLVTDPVGVLDYTTRSTKGIIWNAYMNRCLHIGENKWISYWVSGCVYSLWHSHWVRISFGANSVSDEEIFGTS